MLILLAMLATADVRTMTLPQVDQALYDSVYAARSGLLLFGPSQYICDDIQRRSDVESQSDEYRKLEHEYKALGGKLAADEEQDIWSPAYHTECTDRRHASERFRVTFADVRNSLKYMKALLRRKKELARPDSGPHS